jgi:O-antigen/teichoic acid export membrane protein
MSEPRPARFSLRHAGSTLRSRLLEKDSRSSLVYLGAVVLGYGITILQNFVFAYLVDAEQFGRITVLLTTFLTLNTFFLGGLDSAVIRFHFDRTLFDSRHDLLAHLALLWFLYGIGMSLLVVGVGYVVIERMGLLPLHFFPDYVMLVAGAWLFSFAAVFQNTYIATKEPWRYGFVLVSSRTILFAGLYLWLARDPDALGGMCFGAALAAAVAALVAAGMLRIRTQGKLRLSKVLRLLPYTVPLAGNTIGVLGFSNGYKVIISTSLPLRDLAMFHIASQFSTGFYMVSSSLLNGFTARVYRALEVTRGHRSSIRFYVRTILWTGVLVFGAGIPCAIVVLQLFKGGQYATSWPLMVILSGAQFIFLVSAYWYATITYRKKTVFLTYATTAGVVTTLVAAFVLLPRFGMYGAALATLLGMSVLTTTSAWGARRLSRTPVPEDAP